MQAAAEIGYPVALKSFDESLRHRLDQSGVRLGSAAPTTSCTAAYEDLSAIAGPWLYVQARCRATAAEVPTVFRITADPSFGALVSFGIGGVATELLDDRAFRAVPLTDADAAELIAAPRAAPLLRRVPRRPAGRSRRRSIDLALRLSALADDLPEVSTCSCCRCWPGRPASRSIGATARIGPPPARAGHPPSPRHLTPDGSPAHRPEQQRTGSTPRQTRSLRARGASVQRR